MNALKTILFLFVGALLSVNSYSQQPYLGVRGGLNLSHMLIEKNNEKLTKGFNFLPGFHIGPTVDIRVTHTLTVNTSLLLSSKGYLERDEDEFQGENIKSVNSLYLLYIDIPLFLKYEFELGSLDVFAGGGPFVGYGFYGKRRIHLSGGGETELTKEDVFWGNDPDLHDFKNLDFGIGLSIGGKLDNFIAEAGYNYSITNISSSAESGDKVKNGVLFISVGYFFSKFYKYGEGSYKF